MTTPDLSAIRARREAARCNMGSLPREQSESERDREALLAYVEEMENKLGVARELLKNIAEFGCMGQHAYHTCQEAIENKENCRYCDGKGFNDVERHDQVDQERCILCDGSGDIRLCHPCQAGATLKQLEEM